MKLIFQALVFHHSKQRDCGLCVFILEGRGAMPLVERVVLKKNEWDRNSEEEEQESWLLSAESQITATRLKH